MFTEPNSVDLHTKPLAYVLDDDREVTDLVSRMLATCGFHPREFADPTACVRTIRETHPEARPTVVVLDLSFRQSDAVDVIRQLEKLRFAGKVLLISGCDATTLNDVQEIGVLHGLKMLSCLNKPFQIEEFRACLNALPELSNEASKEISAAPKADLEHAFVQGWLELWYQPKVDLKALAICGVEALLRVRHLRFAILTPASFMPAMGAPIFTPCVKVRNEAVDGRLETLLRRQVPADQTGNKYTSLRHGCTRLYSTCAQLVAKRSPVPRPYHRGDGSGSRPSTRGRNSVDVVQYFIVH
jgi:DNA-binding response OmpR family regulator